MTCRFIDSLDEPGDVGMAGDAVCSTGVLGAGVFPGGGIVDGFTGVDVSSVALLPFFFTLNRSRLGSKTIRPRITLNLPASVSKIIAYVPFDIGSSSSDNGHAILVLSSSSSSSSRDLTVLTVGL